MSRVEQNLQKMINEGPQKAGLVLQQLTQDAPKDYIIPSTGVSFDSNDNGVVMSAQNGGDQPMIFSMHNHAIGQAADKIGLPRKYISRLYEKGEQWAYDLLAHNLREQYAHRDPSRFMLRTVRDEVRGFMSDRYLRLDSGLLLESFLNATKEVGAVPTKGYYYDTKYYLKMSIPKIFMPVDGDPVVFGMYIRDSMFGDGPAACGIQIDRLICINGMLGEDTIKKVHLGSRVSEDVEISEKTYKLDSAALASAITDTVRGVLSEKSIDMRCEAIKDANERGIDVKEALESLRKGSKITKGEMANITDVFNFGGVEELPPGNTMWRLSNAISTFSKSVEGPRAMELEALAGNLAGLDKGNKDDN